MFFVPFPQASLSAAYDCQARAALRQMLRRSRAANLLSGTLRDPAAVKFGLSATGSVYGDLRPSGLRRPT